MSFYKGIKLVGNSALNIKGCNPLNTIYDIKRLIGRKFSDRSVSKSLGLFNFRIWHDETKHENIRIILDPDTLSHGAKQIYSPEEITSIILREMKKRAQEYLKTEIKKAEHFYSMKGFSLVTTGTPKAFMHKSLLEEKIFR